VLRSKNTCCKCHNNLLSFRPKRQLKAVTAYKIMLSKNVKKIEKMKEGQDVELYQAGVLNIINYST